MKTTRRWATAAAALYVLWGLLHVGLGVSTVISTLAEGTPTTELAAESLMFFLCAALLGAQAIFVALTMTRTNNRLGYWLNTTVLGVVDVAFLLVLALPGHVDLIGGISGPVIWLVATACATAARNHENRATATALTH